jgi:hypothetical protein
MLTLALKGVSTLKQWQIRIWLDSSREEYFCSTQDEALEQTTTFPKTKALPSVPTKAGRIKEENVLEHIKTTPKLLIQEVIADLENTVRITNERRVIRQ